MRSLFFITGALLGACTTPEPPVADAGSARADAGVPATLVWHEVVNAYAPGAVLSVWSDAPDNVWMVGGEDGVGFALHFDGSVWTRHDPGTGAQLWWVHGFDDGTVWVVGAHGGAARWDGTAWTVMDIGAPGATFYGIWGVAPDDLWLVGGPQLEPRDGASIVPYALYHFDGSRFQSQAIFRDPPQGEGAYFYKVWGLDADTAFIVGSDGIALLRQGGSWESRSTPVPGSILFTVTGRAYDDVYAVGGMGTPVMIHWDGRIWRSVALPSDTPGNLPGVWTKPGHPVYIAGARGFTARLDGETWTTTFADTAQSFHATHFDGQRLWAVGGDIDARRSDHIGAIFCSEPVASPAP
jgi:photosystem II stability/assembly factor-like uncharacterized protein